MLQNRHFVLSFVPIYAYSWGGTVLTPVLQVTLDANLRVCLSFVKVLSENDFLFAKNDRPYLSQNMSSRFNSRSWLFKKWLPGRATHVMY